MIILIFFVCHWFLSLFFQTFFLHRYASHKMFSTNKFNERVFHLLTFICQGSSYLNPRAYAIMHREHHAFSDTEKDPHSPYFFKDVFQMMWRTAQSYKLYEKRLKSPEPQLKVTIEMAFTGLLGFDLTYHALYSVFFTSFFTYFLLPIGGCFFCCRSIF